MAVSFESAKVECNFDRTEYGLWCSRCQLPSAIVLHLSALTGSGVFGEVATCHVCTECEQPAFTWAEGVRVTEGP